MRPGVPSVVLRYVSKVSIPVRGGECVRKPACCSPGTEKGLNPREGWGMRLETNAQSVQNFTSQSP